MPTKYKTIGIIGAMGVEVQLLRGMMTEPQSETVSGVEYITGRLAGRDVVLAKCGVGKVFAALCTQTMFLRYHPDCVINLGVAGALGGGLRIGDAAVADQVVQHDMDTSAVGDPVGLISGINKIFLPCTPAIVDLLRSGAEALGLNCAVGTIASGDRFVCQAEDRQSIARQFGAIACEMEAAAVVHVCYVNQSDCGAIRVISDSGDESATEDYAAFVQRAADRAARILLYVLEHID